MNELLKEFRDLVCDAQTFCVTLGKVENLPAEINSERQVLASRFRRAEVKICHSMTHEKRIRNASTKNEKQEGKESPTWNKNTVTSCARVLENAEQEQERDRPSSPHEYIEMSPPPPPTTSSNDVVGIERRGNGHSQTSSSEVEQTDSHNNSKRVSRDRLELLEEDEEENFENRDSVVIRRKGSQAAADDKNGESSSPKSDRKLQKRMSLSLLRNWKSTKKDKVSGSRKGESATRYREQLGSRVEKRKVSMENMKNPEMSGYLRKRDKKIGRWQRRWCVIKGDQFLYADKETDRYTSHAFSLEGYKIESGNTSAYKVQHVIQLVHTENPSFQFAATSSEDKERWIVELQRAAGLIDAYEVPREFDPETLAQLQREQEEADANRQCQTPPKLPSEQDRHSHSQSPLQFYEAVFDFDGGEEDELSFKKGDVLLIEEEGSNEHWLVGSLQTNNDEVSADRKRFVPKSYLQPISTDQDANTKL